MNKHWMIIGGLLFFSIVTLFMGDYSLVLIGLGAGMAGGLAIEYTGVRIVKWWSYGGGFPTQKLARGWGEIGVVSGLTMAWLPLTLALVPALLFPILAFELPNRRNKGWEYYAPTWFVLTGWTVTILTLQIFVLRAGVFFVGHDL